MAASLSACVLAAMLTLRLSVTSAAQDSNLYREVCNLPPGRSDSRAYSIHPGIRSWPCHSSLDAGCPRGPVRPAFERVEGVEPSFPGWKPGTSPIMLYPQKARLFQLLPLHSSRDTGVSFITSSPRLRPERISAAQRQSRQAACRHTASIVPRTVCCTDACSSKGLTRSARSGQIDPGVFVPG